MDVRRLILFVVLSFSILFFWNTWQEKHHPVEPVVATHEAGEVKASTASIDVETQFRLQTDKRIHVQTDLFKGEIDTLGGDLRKLELTQHRAADSDRNNFVLLNDQSARRFTLCSLASQSVSLQRIRKYSLALRVTTRWQLTKTNSRLRFFGQALRV